MDNNHILEIYISYTPFDAIHHEINPFSLN